MTESDFGDNLSENHKLNKNYKKNDNTMMQTLY